LLSHIVRLTPWDDAQPAAPIEDLKAEQNAWTCGWQLWLACPDGRGKDDAESQERFLALSF
jgi:hypothetical protein